MSIENLYRRCRLRKPGVAAVTQLDRLLAVEEKLVDMRDVIQRAERAQANDGFIA